MTLSNDFNGPLAFIRVENLPSGSNDGIWTYLHSLPFLLHLALRQVPLKIHYVVVLRSTLPTYSFLSHSPNALFYFYVNNAPTVTLAPTTLQLHIIY